MSLSRRRLLASLAAALVAGPASAADPEAWPARPIRLIVPYPAGGNADSTARALALALGERLGQPLIVDNRPGGGGTIGAAAVAKSAPDGYTLLLDATAFSVNPVLLPRLPYNAATDFAPIALITRAPLLLVVPAASPFQNVADLVRAAKARPGRLSYASAGNGGAQHLAGELFKQSARVSITHIPYRGGAPALTDLVSGQIDLMFSAASASGPFVRAGKLRALAVASAQRIEAFPDLPTLAQQGIADAEVAEWNGLFAPAGTPAAILARLESETRAVVAGPALSRRWAEMGVQGAGLPAREFARFVDSESARWGRLIQNVGIRPD